VGSNTQTRSTVAGTRTLTHRLAETRVCIDRFKVRGEQRTSRRLRSLPPSTTGGPERKVFRPRFRDPIHWSRSLSTHWRRTCCSPSERGPISRYPLRGGAPSKGVSRSRKRPYRWIQFTLGVCVRVRVRVCVRRGAFSSIDRYGRPRHDINSPVRASRKTLTLRTEAFSSAR